MKSRGEERASKEYNTQVCSNKERTGNVSSINPYKTEAMLEEGKQEQEEDRSCSRI
jgi:hypothetical protein